MTKTLEKGKRRIFADVPSGRGQKWEGLRAGILTQISLNRAGQVTYDKLTHRACSVFLQRARPQRSDSFSFSETLFIGESSGCNDLI